MMPADESWQNLQARLRVLEKENELLAERAEEISLLGLVAEQLGIEQDPVVLLKGVLERVCILKAMPYGVCLVPSGTQLLPRAAYHARREERGATDAFAIALQSLWPVTQAAVLGPEDLALYFRTFAIASPGITLKAVVLVPLIGQGQSGGCLLFADEHRSPEELSHLLPLLERVADLTQARLDNLFLVEKLERINLHLGLDVAERTEELRTSEARYRTLFNHVPDGVLLVDAGGEGTFGRIEDANEVAAHMHGYSLAELKGLDIEALTAPQPDLNLESFEQRVWRLKPGETVMAELLHRRKDGSTFSAESIGTLVSLFDRQYVLAFSRDITDRKRAQEAMLSTQRTENIGLLAGGIAHDFNNLMTAVMGQTSLALQLIPDPNPGREHLEKALQAAEKASVLTQQMLAYSGRGKFTIQPLSLNPMIEENLQFLEAALPKQIRFELDLDPMAPVVTGDHGQLQQVIMNLVINGAEAIGEAEGVISLRSRGVQVEAQKGEPWALGAEALDPGPYFQLEISDTGCGMSQGTLAQVFDPFFTTKPKGHGLGLSAVQGIIRGHRGGLTVTSEVGKGTAFRILLPAGIPSAPCLAAESSQAEDTSARTVLVVDDEDYMREVVRDSLEAFGHQAILAESGEQALEVLRLQHQVPDLVLLDLTMPGLGGVETFARIRGVAPNLPVVLSSGFAEEEAKAQLKGLDPAGFLQKPYLAKDLIRMVESVALRTNDLAR